MILAPLTLMWNLWNFKKTKWKMISSTLPILTIIGILIIGPMKIIFSSGSWKTQTVLYQNGHLDFKKVEFQIQDVGALGYNKRTVEVIYLTNFFMIVNPVEIDIDKRIEWIKVNKQSWRIDDIISSNILIGKSKDEIIELLDTINVKQFNYIDNNWMYICEKPYKELSTRSPIDILDLTFENNKVIKADKRK